MQKHKGKGQKLEDYEPGATREQVFDTLRRAAQPIKKPLQKAKGRGAPPASTSS